MPFDPNSPLPPADDVSRGSETPRSAAFEHVRRTLAQVGHSHAPVWLTQPARSSAEAAQALGVDVGQIAKSVVFRRLSDAAAVLVIASGDRRVDEDKVAAIVGPLGRADAAFVKAKTGFSIGGVAPVGLVDVAHTLIDRELFRFADIWAAAGHPNGVFRATPAQMQSITAAPVHDVVLSA